MSHSFIKRSTAGFTLIELLVSIGIAMVILSVIVFNQSTYTDAAALAQDADNLALVFSEQQAYGVAVRQAGAGTSNFSYAYGLTASLTNSTASYVAFIDRDGSSNFTGAWNCDGSNVECDEILNLSRGNYLYSVCPLTTEGVDCGSARRVDVTFLRPKATVSAFRFYDEAGQVVSVSNLVGAQIVLKSVKGRSRTVTFYQSGQVSVQ